MKKIGVTQRIDTISSYGERRNALDMRWIELCHMCGLLPILIPNHLPSARGLICEVSFDGYMLTGGNSLDSYQGDAPERDEVERFLITHALSHEIPTLGVCRGMQVIQDYFGAQLQPVEHHVCTSHTLRFKGENRTVNSFHQFGTKIEVPELVVEAYADDGVIEAVSHVSCPLVGIMWHPEREEVFHTQDIKLITEVFECRQLS